jgi:hypothetical protein
LVDIIEKRLTLHEMDIMKREREREREKKKGGGEGGIEEG